MVLHHVACRACCIIEVAATFDAQLLGDGNLHMPDATTPPEWLEQHIAETQRHQVLHRFLAQIMIDAIDLMFFEHSRNGLIDAFGRREIVTQWLFQHHARCGSDEVRPCQVVANGCEQRGRSG